MFSLTLYRDGESDNHRAQAAPAPTRHEQQMKTTTASMFRSTANPRRTTLVHLEDAADLVTAERPEHPVDLPAETANPRRTILMEAPAA